MFRLALASALAAVALANNPAPAYKPAPAPYHPAPAYKPAPYDETPKPYAFEYGVADDYSGSKFNQAESTDGKTTSGSYSVNLPDGRIQTVTYTVNAYDGYVADVKYEGTAKYPEYKPTYKAAPAYKPVVPAPVYKAAPAPAPVDKPAESY